MKSKPKKKRPAKLCTKYIRLFVSGLFAISLPTLAAAQNPQCIALYGKTYNPVEIYPPYHRCGSCRGQIRNPICQTLNRVMIPDWDSPANVVTVPHRGLWGRNLGEGPSENTAAAIEAALLEGLPVVEIDVALSGPEGPFQDVFLGHYFSMAAVGRDRALTPANFTIFQLTQFRMNKRPPSPSRSNSDELMTFRAAIAYAKANGLILMVDPKLPANPTEGEFGKILSLVLQAALQNDALANIVIKTDRSYLETVTEIQQWLPDWNAYEGEFLWSPIINKESGISLDQTIANAKEWHLATDGSKGVLTYEVSLYSPANPAAKAFLDPDNGVTYANLIDFIRQLNTVGKRSALWSIDPMSDKGTLGRLYNWKFEGNTPADRRGNPLVNLSYKYANYALITTDRPDIYQSLVRAKYGTIDN